MPHCAPNQPRCLFNFQESWKPFSTRINPIRILPAMYAAQSYTRENLQTTTRGFVPVRYYREQYAFANPTAQRFPGPIM